MAESTEPLLKRKVYFDGCPGCKQDRRKEASSGIPYKEFFYVWIITLCTDRFHRARFTISTFTAWYGRYIPVRQVVGTRTARYRAVPPKIGRWRSIEGRNRSAVD
ncbi:hypothetical protein BHE74_00055473 [Ensete ventricosum]|nr:hypothetical protein BHE74_00055473 [Ensete ventricosum]